MSNLQIDTVEFTFYFNNIFFFFSEKQEEKGAKI
jgi:hypothetical protein